MNRHPYEAAQKLVDADDQRSKEMGMTDLDRQITRLGLLIDEGHPFSEEMIVTILEIILGHLPRKELIIYIVLAYKKQSILKKNSMVIILDALIETTDKNERNSLLADMINELLEVV